MESTLLDRPVWSSLSATHVSLSLGDELARRYAPAINVFASARDDSDAALDRLARLVEPGERIVTLQAPEIRVPPGLVILKQAKGVQMVAAEPAAADADGQDVGLLGEADADEMLALATLTEPGPFLRQTYRMGRFVGIRIDGRLAAMAGERFRFPGYTEVSGVCTHPDFRGRGLARRLSRFVASGIAARGDIAFLHAWKSNVAAISLYESLGFKLRCEVNFAILAKK
ncbi:MAG TPA: GNAT family N-acetyltransferase [Gammaproteobacteria bacterium]|nr:GNAT family N-acetyltransferase [Gammaproteobacteria bacterium]